MPRENDAYRDILLALNERFGTESDMLTVTQVSRYLGCDTRTIQENKSLASMFVKIGRSFMIHKAKLARWLS